MNKKIIATLLCTLCVGSLITGCKKKEAEQPAWIEDENKETVKISDENKEEPKEEKKHEFKVGTYVREYEEEFADGIETFKSYVYFKEDGTGFLIIQDDVPFTYENGTITDLGGQKYPYEMTGDKTLSVDMGGYTEDYEYLSKDLPEEVQDDMTYFMDGTPKVTNYEAADSFFYLITSDTISFYSTTSTVEYAAEGADLEEMRAAYIEMKENLVPVLFVKTPNAPKEVGIEHVLQYVDGKIYNIIGLDKIESVYKNSGVIEASAEIDGGKEDYFYKPDSNNEMYVFAAKKANGTYEVYDENGTINQVDEDTYKKQTEEAIAGDTKEEEIRWRPLEKALR